MDRIPLFKVLMSPKAKQLVGEVLDSGYIGQGPRVDAFEAAIQTSIRLDRRPLATNSCTSALDLAYHLCGIGAGSYVVSTPVTCTATNAPLVARGARILWADVCPKCGLMDPEDARKLCSQYEVAAIVAVDWGGKDCDYSALRSIGPPVVEDAAHRYLPGGFDEENRGDFVAWSFQAIKALTCGDGGALLVPRRDEKNAELLRWYGLDRKSSASFRCSQTIPESGYKYHMNDIAAAIGLANIRSAEEGVKQAQTNASKIALTLVSEETSGSDRISMSSWDDQSEIPVFIKKSSHWIFCVLVDDQDGFIGHMNELGIDCSPVHARNDKHPCMRGWKWRRLPGVDEFCSREVAVPCGWWLREKHLNRVIEGIRKWARFK